MKKKMILLLMLLACMVNAQAENSISANTVDIPQGGAATIDIKLDNDKQFKGFQLDLTLPEGISYVSYTKGSRLADHTVSTSIQGGKRHFLVASTATNSPISDDDKDGTILSITVKADASLSTSATPQAIISDVIFADSDGDTNVDGITVDFNVIEPVYNVTVSDINVEKGGTGTIEVALENNIDFMYIQFDLTLPDGVSYVSSQVSDRLADHSISYNEDNHRILASTLNNTAFTGTSGTVLTITVQADASLDVNTEHNASIGNIELTTPTRSTFNPASAEFKINIVEPVRTILDEQSTTTPSAEDNAKVTVKRTIAANTWSTICLPFAMDNDQLKAAFGDDVELGDFNGYEVKDGGSTIDVKFTAADAIAANHPYIIKVGTAVSSFDVDGVNIAPEANPANSVGDFFTTKMMLGTYKAETTVPNNCLFLNDNKFWYSKGNTVSKAYRAYFIFSDRLPEASSSRMRIVFDGEATAIETVQAQDGETGVYYNLQGVAVENPGKGLYIKNGKKVIIK